ncbi:lantibiotic dehydratase [Saccharothrix algeriensis]|uniref:Lantibiotic dehydratase n=1 Tax=Saccharothrix algeriensis TaxID=173560 RepID=A0A8T8HWF9_9PSEU|nr:lantibiotic dehydratase [Saccharothrix algeriensis]MBM7814550.1 hypothetical protein [Saccharothrix algeriensis]QTR02842.1 lantibiotic dehydratase [Saccharothrix algeriensis]
MTTTARPAPPALDFVLPPLFLLRVGGLPFDVVEHLRCAEAVGWADAVLDAEAVIAAGAVPLADALAEAMGAHREEPAHRQLLINVRRAVFNGRRPRGARAALDLLDGTTAGMLRRWLDALDRRDAAAAGGPSVLAAEIAARRDRLRALADSPVLRAGVLLSSPSLDRHLDPYLASAAGAPLGKRARRIERSVLEYLYRTACKTSPFSTLTSVGLGTFAPAGGGGGAVRVEPAGGAPRSAARLNVAVLARLSAILCADAGVRGDLPVEAAAGWRVEGDRIRYLRRDTALGEDDGEAAVTVEPVSESLFYLPAGDVLTDVLAALPPGSALTMRALAARLARVDRDPGDVEGYLAHLLRLGLLVVPDLRLDIHDPDPLATYLDGLRRLGAAWAVALADRLDRVRAAVAAYPAAAVDGRRALLAGVREELDAAHADLGRADVPVPRTLVYEDTALPAASVVGDLDVWERRLLPQLRELCRVLPAFDLNVGRRLVTKGFFRARFGAGGTCRDVLSFAHEFQQDFFEQYAMRQLRRRPFDDDNGYVRQENWFKLPEVDALDDARCAAADRMNAALTAGATELVLDRSFVDAVAAHVPDTLGVLDPRSFFLQVADRGDGRPTAVVNRVYSGLTLLFSRFAHLFAGGTGDGSDVVERLRAALLDLTPPGAVFAELRGGYDATNLNLHPAVTAYEIVCPGEVGQRPAAERIAVDDLVIVDDPDEDRLVLRSARLGVEVIPVYLGYLLPMALPEVQQVLLNFSYTGMAQLDLWAGTSVPLPDGTIEEYPRVRFGDVVLQRRMWKLHPGYLPRREPGDDAAAWFLRWRRWQRDNGLPRFVFATPDGAGSAGVERKPLFVDFESAFSLGLLDGLAKSAGGRLAMTEMLPGPDDLWLRDGDDRFVTELVLELDGVRRRS